jgi:predicted dienelactone hydrolase
MKKLSSTLTIILVSILQLNAQFAIGHRQLTFTDASRSNRSISAEVYYPAATAGENVPLATGQFPVLAFGHGFVMTVSAYDVVWNALVPSGYIMILPNTEGTLSPSHSNFGRDLAFLINAMKAEGLNAASPFFGALASTSAVMGHSMGGGASFLAAEYDTTITAIATLAAAVTNPSSTLAALNVRIPSLVIAGSNDCVAAPAQHQMLMYDSLASDCKTYISVSGASHCQFASSNTFCNIGEATCTPAPTISRTVQQNTTFSYLLPWLDYQLKGDITAGNQFQSLTDSGTGITSEQNCSLETAGTGLETTTNIAVSIYPNPFEDQTTIQSSQDLENVTLSVYNSLGQEVLKQKYQSGNRFILHRNGLNSGIYFLNVCSENKLVTIQKIIINN